MTTSSGTPRPNRPILVTCLRWEGAASHSRCTGSILPANALLLEGVRMLQRCTAAHGKVCIVLQHGKRGPDGSESSPVVLGFHGWQAMEAKLLPPESYPDPIPGGWPIPPTHRTL